jgi:UDP-glucose 4-epimerase
MVVCLVTGGAGFVGSHLVEALLTRDHEVRVLDNLTTGTLSNLASVMPAIEFHPGDLADLDFVRWVTEGAEWVFHQASPEAWPAVFSPNAFASSADVMATCHVLRAACEAKVRRVIYASSLRVYGPTSGDFSREDQTLLPVAPEGLAKLLGEKACVEYARDHGLETVRLRYFHVFGPRQPSSSPYATSVRQALKAMLAGRRPVFDGDGLGIQDLIDVGDVVHANLLAAQTPRIAGKVFNVGRGRATSARDVVNALNVILKVRSEPVYAGLRSLTDLANLADTLRAEVGLGFCAGVDLKRGLKRCLESLELELERQAVPAVE